MVRYLITSGAKTGLATVKALKAQGENDIVVGARDPAKSSEALKAAGASKVVELDLTKPETIIKALEGVERVLLTAATGSLDGNVEYAKNVAEAAKQVSSVKVLSRIAGVQQDENSTSVFAKAHGDSAKHLKDSGLIWFTIGPNFFLENWFWQIEQIKSGTVYGAAADGKVGWIAVSDIGEVAAHALLNPEKYNGKHLQISGPEYTDKEVVELIGSAINKPVKYVNLPSDQFKAGLISKGFPESFAGILTDLEEFKASNTSGSIGNVKDYTGKDAVSAKTWVQQNASAFA